jgi:4-hydroxybenzoate polyprenyltransferase
MVKNFFHIVRWPNLLMVGLVQVIIYSQLLTPSVSVLQVFDFCILVLITVLIAASGYVINDYYDTQIDRINQPKRWIAGNSWSLGLVNRVYFALVFIGGILAVVLAFRLGLLYYLILYPMAVLALWIYSYALKCKPLAGNLIVALFCAGVVMIVALPDWIQRSRDAINIEIWFYVVFAFVSTFYREIVKDLEDVTGDEKLGCRTFVVRYGMHAGKIAAVIVGILLVAALLWWDSEQNGSAIKLVLLSLQGAIVASMALLWWARDETYYHHSSTIIKVVMLAGTFLLFLI